MPAESAALLETFSEFSSFSSSYLNLKTFFRNSGDNCGVIRLTATRARRDKGVAISIGSTRGQVPASKVSLPKIAWQIPRGTASFACTNTSQKRLLSDPITRLAVAPALVVRFQKSAPINKGRKADVHRPMNIAVALAIMLPGRIYARMTATRMVKAIPIFVTLTVALDLPFIILC